MNDLHRLVVCLFAVLGVACPAQAKRLDYLRFAELKQRLRDYQKENEDSKSPVFLLSKATSKVVPDSEVQLRAERTEARTWLGELKNRQVLFEADVLDELQEVLQRLPDKDFQAWQVESELLRKGFDTPEWKATEQWLKDFLKVQAFYTDEELLKFQQSLRELTPNETLIVLDHFVGILASRAAVLQRSVPSRQPLQVRPQRNAGTPPTGIAIQRPRVAPRAPRSRRAPLDQSNWLRSLDSYRRYSPRIATGR